MPTQGRGPAKEFLMNADDAYGSSLITEWLLETDSLEGFLQTLADTALELSHAEGAGLTLERNGRPLKVVSAGPTAPKLDEKQYGQDDGPCLQALRDGEEVSVPDMLDESRWGDYPAYAVSCGIRSSFSLPIAAHTHTGGALNLYAGPPDAFEQNDLAALRPLAAQATGGIALAQRISDAEEFADQLQTAVQSRSVIDQALGVACCRSRRTTDANLLRIRLGSPPASRTELPPSSVEMALSLPGGHPPKTPPVDLIDGRPPAAIRDDVAGFPLDDQLRARVGDESERAHG